MKAFKQLFSPISTALAAFFKHDITLRREPGTGVQLVLESRPARKALSPRQLREQAAARKEQEELTLVQHQLAELLAQFPASRATFKQLAFVEQAVAKKGLKAVQKLPMEVLVKAHEQLEGLVTNWSPVGLANLRSRMAVAILDRHHQEYDEAIENPRTAAVLDSKEPTPAPVVPPAEPAKPRTPPVSLAIPSGQARELDTESDDAALMAAYAALGNVAPSGALEFQGELGSRSTRALAPPVRVNESAGNIELRELQH